MIGSETAAYIMSGLIGLPYPEGDPAVLRAAARHWRSVSAATAESEKVAERAAKAMAENAQSGNAVTAFYELTEEVLPRLGQLKVATERLAVGLEKFAEELEKKRHTFNHMAWQVAVDIGVTVAFGFLTVGLYSAVKAVYLARAVVAFFQVFGAYRRAALMCAMLATYFTLDTIAYTALDVGAIKAVDWAYGEKGKDWKDMTLQTAVGNLAFDGAFQGQEYLAARFVGKAFANNVWVRAAMRMTSSGLVYTPVANLVAGKPANELLPTQNEWEQKTAIHMLGRVWLPEHHRAWSAEVGKAAAKRMLGR
ncbi:WXG100-like domain-containing protein [Virgisporangium aurantiacum]|uniref:Outer membrane channel protein CpnT-like N-terminal domain-containing protein n=1 Tax=Virgisporangium aurantiacum TaxID=175570 RepID=A0A8J3Z6P2_9ACTN|nr:hypothetical protein [Virgisporangium aurantiacum]GIJ55898.1 hypothetical protein Vau01_034140 [Virgisporangium aurantiacum]